MTGLITSTTVNTLHDTSLVDALTFIHIATLLILMGIQLVAASSSWAYGPVLARLSRIGIYPMLFSFAVIVFVRLSVYI